LAGCLFLFFFSDFVLVGYYRVDTEEMLSCSFLLAIFVRVLVCIVSPMWDLAEILVVGEG
jgi:hypothetical protein